MPKRSLVKLLLVLLLLGGSAATAHAQSPDRNLHASGRWRDEVRGEGEWSADLAIEGNALTGVLEISGHPELSAGEVSGSASGQALTMVMEHQGLQAATFVGSFSDTGLVGKFETGTGATGTWAGSWNASAPQIATSWSSDVALREPVLTERRPPRVSGIKRWSRARVERLSSGSPVEGPRRWAQQFVTGLGDGIIARTLGQLVDTAFAAVTVTANVLVNNPSDAGDPQNEPEIAVDRLNNPSKLAAGANDYSFGDGSKCGYYFSTDAGLTWPARGQIPGLTSYEFGGDPVLDFDAAGRAFFAGIAFNETSNTNNTIFVARSPVGTTLYQAACLVATSSDEDDAFHDKPWVAVNRVSGSSGYGNVYVCWTVFTDSFTNAQIYLARSTDNGTTYPSAVPVSADVDSHGCSVAVALNGDVNVAWLRHGNQLMLDTCTNAGTTCGTDQLRANITPLPDTLPGTTYDMNSFPTLAIDTAPGGGGYKAIVWADYRAGNADIYFTLYNPSTMAWLTPKAIASTTTDEFFPTITIDSNHFQQVLYYRRTSQAANTFNAFTMLSGNGQGNFSAPTQVNDGGNISPTNQFSPNFIGDYLGIDGTTTRQLAWMDSRRTIPGTSSKQQDIYTATASGC